MALILPSNSTTVSLLAEKLTQGELVAFPTETVYGLGADATNSKAVAAIYQAKGRPSFNPLIAHYPSQEAAAKDAIFSEQALQLAQAFWPGPLTLVLPKKKDSKVCALATSGLDTIAVRVPAHPVALELLKACGTPIVAPSANPSGFLSPVTAQQVEKGLGLKINWILDGGKTTKGLESTIVDCTTDTPTILRHGPLTLEMLAKTVPTITESFSHQEHAPKAPGMLLQHYAPHCPLRLTITNPQPKEGLLAFGSGLMPLGFDYILNLSPTGDLQEAAANLFDYLHKLEDLNVSGIAVMSIPREGLGEAIHDKLKRAAHGSHPH